MSPCILNLYSLKAPSPPSPLCCRPSSLQKARGSVSVAHQHRAPSPGSPLSIIRHLCSTSEMPRSLSWHSGGSWDTVLAEEMALVPGDREGPRWTVLSRATHAFYYCWLQNTTQTLFILRMFWFSLSFVGNDLPTPTAPI